MGKRLSVKVGKFADEVTGSLKRGDGGVLPHQFFYREMNLKFSIDVNTKKTMFVLDVQDRMFENLPWRPMPIYLKNPDEDGEKNMKAYININGVEILGDYEEVTENFDTGIMTWDA